MRRVFTLIFAFALFFVSYSTYGQRNNNFYFNQNLLIESGDYCRTVRFELNGLSAWEIRQRSVSDEFWREFGLEFWSIGFDGRFRTGAQGHVYDFREEKTGMLFQDITYCYAFACSDGVLEITLCHITPGYARRHPIGIWRYFWQDLSGGVDSIEYYGIDRPRVKKWQLALIRYMDGFFQDQAPKMRDYILSHPSEYESLQMKEN